MIVGVLASLWGAHRDTAALQPLVTVRQLARSTVKLARKSVTLVVGSTVLVIGLAMVVLPGPALVVIPLGLAILATQFVWARRLLKRARSQVHEGVDHVRDDIRSLRDRARGRKPPPPPGGVS